MVEEGAILIFVNFARSRDECFQINSADLLQILGSRDESIRQSIIKEGGVRIFTRNLDPKSSSSSKSKEASLPAIENFVPRLPSLRQHFDQDFLNHLLIHLSNSNNNPNPVQEQSLRVSAKLCRTSEEAKKALGDAGFMPALAKLVCSKSFEIREMAAEALLAMVSITRNRRKFVQDDASVNLLQGLDPDQGDSSGNRRFLLSTVMELRGSNSGRKKIMGSGYVKNIEKLAQAEVSDAKRIIRKLSTNRFRRLIAWIFLMCYYSCFS